MNINICDGCSFNCQHCFCKTATNYMTVENFKKTLDWMILNGGRTVNITGGEPTENPDFLEIFNIAKRYSEMFELKLNLETNGINLHSIELNEKDPVEIMINIPNEINLTSEEKSDLIKSLEYIKSIKGFKNEITENRLRAGVNADISLLYDNYDFFWNIVDRFEIKFIRTIVTVPKNTIYWNNKKEYFKQLKPTFLNFLRNAFLRDVIVIPMCNTIPPCYFNNIELAFIAKLTERWFNYFGNCAITPSVGTDLSVKMCVDKEEKHEVRKKITDFKSYRELEQYCSSFAKNNLKEECRSCILFKNNFCHNGCYYMKEE